jgi:hypothetical protein
MRIPREISKNLISSVIYFYFVIRNQNLRFIQFSLSCQFSTKDQLTALTLTFLQLAS